MTGGGLGVHYKVVNSNAIEDFQKIVTQGYYNTFNIEPEIYVCIGLRWCRRNNRLSCWNLFQHSLDPETGFRMDICGEATNV